MICPYCKSRKTKVIDKRDYATECITRRRRECEGCQKRFTTYEKVDELSIFVIKKDGTMQNFDESKLRRGVEIAAEKRISRDEIEKLVEEIKLKLLNRKTNKVSASDIGRMVLTRLRHLDPIAYMRFASVFLEFDGLEEFKRELSRIDSHK